VNYKLDKDLVSLVKLIKQNAKGRFIATAESCTGGLVSSYLTSVSGSSKYFSSSIITYSNIAKMNLLGVKKQTLDNWGAVSEQVAQEMALGVMKISGSDIAISITGIAGPGGGTREKPVGTVCFCILSPQDIRSETYHFSGTRHEIRIQSCKKALALILSSLQ
jgi:PncC family amidohydrolase